MSRKNIKGKLKYYEVESLLKQYYEIKNTNDINIQREKECDLVSLRSAQLRSNYGDIIKGIYPTFEYIIMFFENLFQGTNHELKNRDLYIKDLFENNN